MARIEQFRLDTEGHSFLENGLIPQDYEGRLMAFHACSVVEPLVEKLLDLRALLNLKLVDLGRDLHAGPARFRFPLLDEDGFRDDLLDFLPLPSHGSS